MKDQIMGTEEAKSKGIAHQIELDFEVEFLKKYKLVKSESSCLISEIEGFVFGPFTSRFWIMRK